MDKFFLSPTKYGKDPNLSFSYYRSFILFYYLSQLIPQSKTLFSQFYPEAYYSFYQDNFEKKQNILLFTYYNCLPSALYPLPESMYYDYSPLVTFYTNPDKTLYQQKDIVLSPSVALPLRPDRTEVPNELRITLPTDLIQTYPLNPAWHFFLQDASSTILIGTNARLEKDSLAFDVLYVKKGQEYRAEIIPKSVPVQEIRYVCFLQPITTEGILQVFPQVTLPEGSYVFANYKEGDKDTWGQFFALYPFLNMLDSFQTLPKSFQWNCFTFKVKKAVSLLNINVDPFYANPIIGDDPEGEDYDLSDLSYNKKVKSKLLRCRGSPEKRCNLNVLYDFQTQTWVKNMSRTMLMLIIFKHRGYFDFKRVYYLDFLAKLGLEGLINHNGIYRKKDKDVYLETEIAFTTKEYSKEYLVQVSQQKGSCDKHYPKRR